MSSEIDRGIAGYGFSSAFLSSQFLHTDPPHVFTTAECYNKHRVWETCPKSIPDHSH